MKRFLKHLLGPTLERMASSASKPDRDAVFKSLSDLIRKLSNAKNKGGCKIQANISADSFIIFSDHHKGNRDASDDFAYSEKNYIAALEYYYSKSFHYINLGDGEELWKYKPSEVIPKNVHCFQAERKFQDIDKYTKTFGNHDLIWKDKLEVAQWFKDIFRLPLPIYEGVLISTIIEDQPLKIFLTHGHQGDKMSDNNPVSTWLVSHLWRPLQRYLEINVNTPANDYSLRDKHNMMMYEWSSRRNDKVLLITGHTHKPVFAAGLYSDHPNNRIPEEKIQASAEQTRRRPTYFNSGCCCYNDGDITGIEISGGMISLVKWKWANEESVRTILEEAPLSQLIKDL